jgi:hypothetical protein
MTNEPLNPRSSDADLRAAYDSGVRVCTIMKLTKRDYESVKKSLARIGAHIRTGDKW